MATRKQSIRSRITALEQGESITYSLNEVGYSTLRAYAYTIGLETGNTYSTSINKVNREFTIIRTK